MPWDGPVCGSICRPGSFAQRPGPSGELPGFLGPLGNPSMGNHDFSLLPPLSALPYPTVAPTATTHGIQRREHQFGHPPIPYGPVAMLICQIPSVHVPVPAPVPGPVPVPIHGRWPPSAIHHRSCGWLDPPVFIPATVTQSPQCVTQSPHWQGRRAQCWTANCWSVRYARGLC
jgi:hypothetical protein